MDSVYGKNSPALVDDETGTVLEPAVTNWLILVGEQSNDGLKFSRGRVLNALALIVAATFPNATIVLHDVDLLPDTNRLALYSQPAPPPAIVTALNSDGEYRNLKHYIGGVCALPLPVFLAANGFPNRLWGWGGEDDALRNALFLLADKSTVPTYVDSTGKTRLNLAALIYSPCVGSMTNMETDVHFVEAGHVRARDVEAERMPKDAKRDIVRLAATERIKDGVAELVFGLLEKRDLGQGVLVYKLELDVVLPPSWSCEVSRSKGKPFYCNPAVTAGQWAYPPGTVVSRVSKDGTPVKWTVPRPAVHPGPIPVPVFALPAVSVFPGSEPVLASIPAPISAPIPAPVLTAAAVCSSTDRVLGPVVNAKAVLSGTCDGGGIERSKGKDKGSREDTCSGTGDSTTTATDSSRKRLKVTLSTVSVPV
jgi:hypothetical protein